MNYPKYTISATSSNLEVFEFISEGKKGNIIKQIQFSKTDTPRFYNLGFGDKMVDGAINDSSNSDNGDRDLILATIANAVYEFTAIFPDRYVVFFGIDAVRTRLYRMAISKNFDELNKNFYIFALVLQEEDLLTFPFATDIRCDGFLVKRKDK